MKRIVIALAMLASVQLAYAEGHSRQQAPANTTWQAECGSCHVAYPPNLLSADNWKKLMGSLDKHFGNNAELDTPERKIIEDYLVRYASNDPRRSADSLRITDTRWFKREHRGVSPKEWVHPQVKSASNCNACHMVVARGSWSEHDVRLPGRGRWEEYEDDDD